ncbi:MAG: TonB-dependent receptor, partial [Acetobacteraceae bacterium]|nr:TonB-dependent receptor [Acetobacteraceae bacterium]
MKSKVCHAVAAILGGASFGALSAQPDPSTGPAGASGPPQVLPAEANSGQSATAPNAPQALAEVVVTATRRSESSQNVPITMQALDGQTLQQLHVSSFEDYVRMLPNLSSADNGPGQNEIFIRGVSAGSQATQASGIIGLWPSVAVYLDDQSVQLPNQNLDVYMVDINRIEVLEGPQGTLFGSGAEAGAIRYITNEPKLNAVEGNFSGDYGITAHGDPNTALTGVLNLPIIPDRLAMRFVAYNDRQGGYIDNVPGTFTRKDTDFGVGSANFPAVNGHCPDGGVNNGFCVPPGSPVLNNSGLVRNNINPVTYQGARVGALYKFSDDWDLLLTQSYQSLDAEGVFYQHPFSPDGQPLSPQEVVLFAPSYHYEKDSNTAWRLKGKAEALDLIYTGGLLTRNVENQADYTNYARGIYGDYYQCYGPGSGGNKTLKSTCFSPLEPLPSNQQNRHFQNELRAQTPGDWRLRGILGFFQEKNVIYDETYYNNISVPACTSNGPPGSPGNSGCFSIEGTFPDTTVQYPGLQNKATSFFNDALRQERQIAEFTSVSFDLTPQLTLTGGARHFAFFNSLAGVVQTAFGCFQAGTPPGGCHDPAFSTNLNAANLSDTESGWRYQANLSWNIDPTLFDHQQHILAYLTFSQGFRPGGFNQNGGSLHGLGPDGQPQFVLPASYHPDKLNNYEFGWKTNWRLLDRYVQWNTSFYREDWNNVQISFFDPPFTGTAFFDDNGQNFRINGAETQLAAQLWGGLTLRGAAAWNSSEQLNSPTILDNNPASANFGKVISELCPTGPASCAAFANPFGPRGAPAADSPPIHFTLLVRYDFTIASGTVLPFLSGGAAHVQLGMQHQGHSFTQAGSNPPFLPGETIDTGRARFEDPAYSTYDASVGVSKDKWSISAYGQNLANSNAAVFTSTDQFIVAQTLLRPRVLGVR